MHVTRREKYRTGAELFLGTIFSTSSIGKDDIWLIEDLRPVIEKYGTSNMLMEMACTVKNQRDVFTVTGGKEELKIAQKYEGYASELEMLYPKCAEVNKLIAEGYYRDSKRYKIRDIYGY